MHSILRTDRNRIRIIALFILIILIAASFTSEALIMAKVRHDCAGNGYLSEYIKKAKTLDLLIVELLASASIVLILLVCLFAGAAAPVKNIILVVKSTTLIGKMVRMNN